MINLSAHITIPESELTTEAKIEYGILKRTLAGTIEANSFGQRARDRMSSMEESGEGKWPARTDASARSSEASAAPPDRTSYRLGTVPSAPVRFWHCRGSS